MVRATAPLALLLAIAGCGSDDGGSGSAPPVMTYAVSGSVSHLDSGSLSISDGSETVTVAQGASSFAFTRPLANGTAYTVSVTTQPSGSNCVVNNASGTVNGAAISNVAIVCNTLVAQPLAIGVSASGSLNSNGSRIFLPVSQVGTTATTINAILDTGSAGTLLRASDVFPATMVSSNGFVFPSGQTSISYNGITVTNVVATRIYGEQSNLKTEQTGNLGFAQVTFGSGTRATTAAIPILFVYQTKSNGTVVATTHFANLIGVNASISPISVGGAAPGSTPSPCTPQSTTTCGLTSPFRYLSYADGTDKGFILSKVTFAPCDITVPGACPVTPNLTLGVTAGSMTGFSMTPLSSCSAVMLIGATEQVCSQVISSVMVSSGNASFTGPAIFDSGAPTTRLSVPMDMTFPDMLADGSIVRIAPTSTFAYQYVTGTGYLTTNVSRSMNTGDYSNTGIGFFAQNSLLVDYSRSSEGWRAGS